MAHIRHRKTNTAQFYLPELSKENSRGKQTKEQFKSWEEVDTGECLFNGCKVLVVRWKSSEMY